MGNKSMFEGVDVNKIAEEAAKRADEKLKQETKKEIFVEKVGVKYEMPEQKIKA